MTQQKSMTVAVAGATGFVGRHVVGELTSRGHRVRALVRDNTKAGEVLGILQDSDRITRVTAPSLSEASARELTDGADACVNCIGIIREEHGNRFDALHVRAVEMLTEACRSSGAVERFVQVSALGVTPDGRAKYQRTKAEGERVVRHSGLAWTIFRPSAVLGEGGELMEMMREWARGRQAPFAFMPYFTRRSDGQWSVVPSETTDPRIAPVLVEDLARAVADSLEQPETAGEVYNICGSESVTWPELLTAVRDSTPGAKPNISPAGIPAPAAHAAATVAGFLGLGGLLPFDPGMAAMAAEDSTADLAKFESHFGFEPRSFRDALGTPARAGV